MARINVSNKLVDFISHTMLTFQNIEKNRDTEEKDIFDCTDTDIIAQGLCGQVATQRLRPKISRFP